MSAGTSNSSAFKRPNCSLSMSVSVAGEGHQLPQSCHGADALALSFTTAAFYGVPFIVLRNAREIAQNRKRTGLIQPAPTLPNDSRGLACGLGYGVAADTQKNCND